MAYSNQFNIEVGAILNTDNVPKQLQELNAQLQKSTSSMVKVKVGVDENNKAIFDNLLKEVNTYKDKFNNTIREIKLIDPETGELAKHEIKQITSAVKDFTTETTTKSGKITDTINGVTKAFNGTITTTKKVSNNGEELTTVVSKYTNNMGQAVERTETFNKTGTRVAETMRKISDASKGFSSQGTATVIGADGSKSVTQYADGVATLTTKTREYTTALGALVQETTTYNAQTGELINKNTKVVADLQKQAEEAKRLSQYKQELVTATKEENTVIQRGNQTYSAIKKTIQEQTHEYGTLTTTIYTYKDALGNTVVETKKTNAAGQEVAQTTKTVTKELDKGAASAKNFGESAERANYGVKNLGWSLGDAISRLTNFYIASLPIRAVQTAITDTVQTVKDFDAAITEMGKVTDYSGEKLRKYTKDLAELGTEVARTQTEMTEAATGWLKAGYSEEDAALLSKYSALLQNTADEEMSAADATSVLVSQLKAYHMEAEDAIKVTDIINKVSANQAVSSYDISQGLTVASAAMSTFGNSIEKTTALLTAGTTIFQGRSSQVARG